MTDPTGSNGERPHDPMGVRRRWGKRELALVLGAVLVVMIVTLLASWGLIGGTAASRSGQPGVIPGGPVTSQRAPTGSRG